MSQSLETEPYKDIRTLFDIYRAFFDKEQGKIRGEFFSDFIPSIRSNQHLIYYLASKNKLLVVGILHDQQIHPEHLTLRESEHEHLGPEKYIERIVKLGERLQKGDIKKEVQKVPATSSPILVSTFPNLLYTGERPMFSTVTNHDDKLHVAWLYNPRISASVSHNENCWMLLGKRCCGLRSVGFSKHIV